MEKELVTWNWTTDTVRKDQSINVYYNITLNMINKLDYLPKKYMNLPSSILNKYKKNQ